MQSEPESQQKLNGWFCSFQQWHPRWIGNDRLSNSYRPAMSNPRPVGRIRPSQRFCVAQFRFFL